MNRSRGGRKTSGFTPLGRLFCQGRKLPAQPVEVALRAGLGHLRVIHLGEKWLSARGTLDVEGGASHGQGGLNVSHREVFAT